MSCGGNTLWSNQGNKTVFVRARCKTWACPKCGPRLRKAFIHNVSREASKKNLRRFVTLTIANDLFAYDVAFLRRSWHLLRQQIQREFGKIEYISVVEFGKRGSERIHLHLLVSEFLPQKWLSAHWQMCGGGPVVDIRYIDVHRIVGYLSKYFSKDFFENFRKGKKRYSTSRGIVLKEKIEQKYTWEFSFSSVEYLASVLKLHCFPEGFEKTLDIDDLKC